MYLHPDAIRVWSASVKILTTLDIRYDLQDRSDDHMLVPKPGEEYFYRRRVPVLL